MTYSTAPYTYPELRRDESVVEELHGHKIPDPYRWLEDPDSKETRTFVDAEMALTRAHLDKYADIGKVRERLTTLFDYERYGVPFRRGSHYYYFHNSGLQNQAVLYKQDTLESEPRVFLDPNVLEEDGTASLSSLGFTEDGRYLAYGLSRSGSDWVTIYVKDGETGKDLEDVIEWAKFTGIEWSHDNAGFFYTRYPKPQVEDGKEGTETGTNVLSTLCYHRLGTSQSEDVTIIPADKEHPQYRAGAEVTDDGAYLIISVSESTARANKLWVTPLGEGGKVRVEDLKVDRIVDDFSGEYDYLANDGPVFYFKTNKDAPRYKVVRYDLTQKDKGFELVVPEHAVDVLDGASVVAEDNLILTYMHDVKSVLYIHDLRTGQRRRTLDLPIGSIGGVSGRREDPDMFYSHASFLNPGIIYRHRLGTGETSTFRVTHLGGGVDVSDLEQQQVFVTSKDGKTQVPVFLVSRKGIKLDGSTPMFLYGYGGFSIPLKPAFSPTWLNFILHFGGCVAVANIRGGGEYGESWHEDGMLGNKQHVFDDFQSVARWLIQEGWTSPARLAINGGSNGGLLVGACVNQAPELFGAAVADVGVMDMLRFHKFTIGHAWKADYGDPEVKEDFETVLRYSPLHNVQVDKPYPSVLLTTSDHDDRVVPLHSYKYIAELQYRAGPLTPNPLLIRIETKAGHGAGKPTKKRIEEAAEKYAFIAMAIGATWKD
ncbi:prolyl oligopeptidase [Piptocephalis cylindrospora]|uniref:Prolyl endopeptidase n=1 Tax=Piptocephalis cylindrospora TaxID=1907219 RepID=A0A4P9Y8D2_9FUNG|nr:prolyl oligopeptidase [Piptocephalis cylindrospora]|eukprot:RKP15052.1 prolyl oligopeptidase [Piptocephalis cylindrospora]